MMATSSAQRRTVKTQSADFQIGNRHSEPLRRVAMQAKRCDASPMVSSSLRDGEANRIVQLGMSINGI